VNHMRGAPRHDDAVGPVLTVSEVADTLRVSSMTVYRLVKAGELPALRIGKNIRIRATDLEGYLASGVVASDMQNG
jgi:excisionase family DNA binding protein